jgi:hypothetical protein
MSSNILLIGDLIIKERTGLHDNLDPKLLYPEIKIAQDRYIHPLLGTALFNKILSDYAAQTLSGNYLALKNDYIVDALVYYTLAELPEILSFQFYNKGLLRKNEDNATQPSLQEIIMMGDKYKDRAEYYGNRLRLYLRQNYPLFPEYNNPGSGVDTIFPTNRAYTSPVYLGLGFNIPLNLEIDKGVNYNCGNNGEK